MTRLSMIVAMDRNRVIGAGGGLPWRMPADLRRFKALTMGKPMLMGRRTWESIGRPLPGRESLVVSRDPSFRAEGARIFPSIDEALAAAADAGEVVCIGGADLYRALLPRADRLYITLIDHAFEGDVYFPEFDAAQWTETFRQRHEPDMQNPFPYTYIVLDRKGHCTTVETPGFGDPGHTHSA